MSRTSLDIPMTDGERRQRSAHALAAMTLKDQTGVTRLSQRTPSGTRQPHDAPPAGRTATFVGRAIEFGRLRAAAELARRGIATMTLVEGAPGIGKSALVDRFAASCADFRVLSVTPAEEASDEPYGLLAQMLARLGGPAGVSIGRLSGNPAAVVETFVSALSDAAAADPVLLIVDDVHLADPESLSTLRFALRRMADERVLAILVADYLADGDGRSDHRPSVSEVIRLDGLGRQEIDELVRTVTGRPDAQLGVQLARWTGGNPTLIWALLADRDFLADSGQVVPAAGLVGALRAMAARFPAPSRTVLATLSLLRNPAEAGLVSAVSGVAEIEAAARPLTASRWITWSADPAGRPALSFVNSQHYDAVYEGLDAHDRRVLHLAASGVVGEPDSYEHMMRAGAGPDEDLAARLDAASDAETVVGNYARAGRYSWWAADMSASADGRERRLTKAVRLLVRTGQDGPALQLKPSVDALAPTWRREEAVGLLAFAAGAPAAAWESLRRAEAACPPTLAGDRARLAAEFATVAGYLCAGQETVAAAHRAVDSSDHPEIVGIATAMESFGHALIDGPRAGLSVLARIPQEPSAVTANDLPALTFRGVLRGLLGSLPSAIADLTVASRRRASARTAVLGLSAHIHLATSQFLAGSWRDADQTLAAAVELAPAYGRHLDRAAIHSTLAILHSWQGDPVSAGRELERSTDLSRTVDSPGPLFHQRVARGVLAWVAEDPRRAVAALAPLLAPAADEQRTRLYGIWWLPTLGAAQLDAGLFDDAAATIQRIADLDAAGPLRDTVVAWLTGRLALARGETATALRVLSDARSAIRFDGNIYVGHLIETLAEARHRAGDLPAAKEAFASAISTFDAIGAVPFAQRCRARRDRAIGSGPEKGSKASSLPQLTEKERQVADRVAQGRTNREIAQEMYVSPKTVEYHLRNAFNKLGITGRRELRDLIQSQTPAA